MFRPFGPFGSELAELRAESLRADWGRRPKTSPGSLRRAVGRRFIAAGERLLDQCHIASATDIEMGDNR